jgi:hypothetical protein
VFRKLYIHDIIYNMELAIPLIALGSLYIVSNQSAKSKKCGSEGFSSKLPNVDVRDRNYPPSDSYTNDTDVTSEISTLNRYEGTAYTDKYFNPSAKNSLVSESVTANKNQYQSLSGQQVESDYFKHNNMMPFFGGKIRSSGDGKNNEAVLDNYLGTGSTQIVKSEQAPMFSPNEKIEHPYGAPNMNDFYQSRVNPSLRMNGVKPFQEEQVGPGLGLGANQNTGSGGYNAGNLSRETWLPKTVDDLRTANNQKATDTMFLGHEGPAKSRITNVGILGAFQKNRPETAFEWGQDRLFTTNGVGKGQTSHAIPVERHVNRPDTTVEYEGVAQSLHSVPINPGEILPSHRTENGQTQLGSANAIGRGFANEGDYGSKSNQVYMNNRSYGSANDDSYFGSVKSGLGAVVAPLLEIMRPSRKQNVVGNMRVYGDAKSAVSQSYLYNPNDAPAHTMRETTEESVNHLNVNRGQVNNGYLATPYQVVGQQRDTSTTSYIGGGGYQNSALRPYDAELSHQPSDVKASTINGRFGNSNMKLFNGDVNYQGKPKDFDMTNNRELMPKMPSQIQSHSNFGEMNFKSQQLNTNIQMDRNTPDLYAALNQNPYALKRTYAT